MLETAKSIFENSSNNIGSRHFFFLPILLCLKEHNSDGLNAFKCWAMVGGCRMIWHGRTVSCSRSAFKQLTHKLRGVRTTCSVYFLYVHILCVYVTCGAFIHVWVHKGPTILAYNIYLGAGAVYLTGYWINARPWF